MTIETLLLMCSLCLSITYVTADPMAFDGTFGEVVQLKARHVITSRCPFQQLPEIDRACAVKHGRTSHLKEKTIGSRRCFESQCVMPWKNAKVVATCVDSVVNQTCEEAEERPLDMVEVKCKSDPFCFPLQCGVALRKNNGRFDYRYVTVGCYKVKVVPVLGKKLHTTLTLPE